MQKSKFKITSQNSKLKNAIDFHGHLGPYLVLGIKAGEYALKKLNAKKYFGLEVKVWGATKKPKSCLIDGLQLSTGATYGKGNIKKITGGKIKIEIVNCVNGKKMILSFKDHLALQLDNAKTHSECWALARKLFKTNSKNIFNLILNP